jgi:hypothetical protein
LEEVTERIEHGAVQFVLPTHHRTTRIPSERGVNEKEGRGVNEGVDMYAGEG